MALTVIIGISVNNRQDMRFRCIIDPAVSSLSGIWHSAVIIGKGVATKTIQYVVFVTVNSWVRIRLSAAIIDEAVATKTIWHASFVIVHI